MLLLADGISLLNKLRKLLSKEKSSLAELFTDGRKESK